MNIKDSLHDNMKLLIEFLPYSYFSKENHEFHCYMFEGFAISTNHGKFQYSYLTFYMLFFTGIYKFMRNLYHINQPQIKQYIDALIPSKLSNFSSPFDLSVIGEKEIIEKLFGSLGFHANQIAEVKSFLDKRNHCAHSSGIIQYNGEDVFITTNKLLKYLTEVDNKVWSLLKVKLTESIKVSPDFQVLVYNHLFSVTNYKSLYKDRDNFLAKSSKVYEDRIVKESYLKLYFNDQLEGIIEEEHYLTSLLEEYLIGFDENGGNSIIDFIQNFYLFFQKQPKFFNDHFIGLISDSKIIDKEDGINMIQQLCK